MFGRIRPTLLITSISLTITLFPIYLPAQEIHEVPITRPVVHYELLRLMPDDTTKARLDLNFNIPDDFFVYVRSAAKPNGFAARGEITAEVLNSRDISVAREIVQKELHRAETIMPEGQSGRAVQGSLSFSLDPGTYRVIFEVNDLESGRKFVDRSQPIPLKTFSNSSTGGSDILFLSRVETTNDSLTKVYPVNHGGDVIFGKNFTTMFQSATRAGDSGMVYYSIHKVGFTSKRISVFSDSARPIPSLANCRVTPVEADSVLVFALRSSKNPPIVNTYLVEIQGDTLQWGQYDIEMRTSKKIVARKSFTIHWINMPRVLANIALASEALEYLMPEQEFDEFRKHSPEAMQKQLEEFWKKRDPTPQTAYNEAMAEYYTRCDFALENFRTLGQANGIKTDRGKIYILYGPPTKTDRYLTPGEAPREIWYYEKLGKKFVFVDESRNGNYKLFSTERL